jgi:putative hydrolase of the HAD superfamily
MTEQFRYSTILFDWGDTVMRDYPATTIPMVDWKKVEVIDGVADVLAYLHESGRRIVLATSASISNEKQIWGALARGGLDKYFSHIYCFKNTKLPKGETFYHHILNDLKVHPSNALMVGDGFEKDVQVPNSLGMYAIWFNPRTDEIRNGELHITVRSMEELLDCFKLID